MNANRFISAVAIISGLLSASASAQSTNYWDFPKAFRASTLTAAARVDTDPKIFESSLLHLRETHGVGLPSSYQTVAKRDEGAMCHIGKVAIAESFRTSLINPGLTHGVEESRAAAICSSAAMRVGGASGVHVASVSWKQTLGEHTTRARDADTVPRARGAIVFLRPSAGPPARPPRRPNLFSLPGYSSWLVCGSSLCVL